MRTCVITGASSGIGLASARRFLQAGDRVIACARDRSRLETAVAELGDLGPITAVSCDVADQSAVESALGDLDRVDVLVAAAGVCRQARLDDANTDAIWHEVIDVNLHGAYYSIKAVAPKLSDGAAIVAVSSGLGKNARAGYEAYCASKHGLLGLVKCVALELAPRVRVNAVCPGWVDTPMSRADIVESAGRNGVDPDAFRAKALAGLALGRVVTADDVARQIFWLASDDASAITGQSYNISCGEYFN